MRPRLIPPLVLLCAVATFYATGAEKLFKAEAILVWGTNESTSPDKSHKPVDEEVRKKVKELPFKWTNYFEVNRKTFELPVSGSKKETLSDKCAVEIKYLGQSRVEVSLFGKGDKIVRRTQDLPQGETLMLGGNAPNSTSWLVLVRQVK